MHEIGKKLRTAREAKKITIEMLAEWTKINPIYLQKIEDGEWDFFPDPYIHGIVRKFAACVGLDADELLQQYAILAVTKYIRDEKHSAEKSAKIRAFRSKVFFSRTIRMVIMSLAALTLFLILLLLLICSATRASRIQQQQQINNSSVPLHQIEMPY